MIIIPNRFLSNSKLLVPVPKKEWMPSSQSIPKDEFGLPVIRTFFRIRARLNDGYTVWTGIFKDRDDFDAFLFSIANDRLKYDRELWKLPTPEWHPGIGENLQYDFTKTTFYTATGNSTWTSPIDWNNRSDSNEINVLGAGGSGGVATTTGVNAHAAGGGGGGYARLVGYVAAIPGTTTVPLFIGSGGAASTRNLGTSGFVNGSVGQQTYFDSGLGNPNGGGGGFGPGSTTSSQALNGGTAGGSTNGNPGYVGGAGGSTSSNGSATGGGGAAGINGTGGNAAAVTTTNSGGNGGAGDAGTGGAVNGFSGNEWGTSFGSGGGGQGIASNNLPVTGQAGGAYGAGGGGVAIRNMSVVRLGVSGAGRQGLIRVVYIPRILYQSNIPMLGF